jgi:clan AA aspartic protease
MGYVYTNIELSNPKDDSLGTMKVRALVDTGALMLCIPKHIQLQLQLKEFEKREVTFADGKRDFVSYVGPVMVKFENRICFVGALVLGDEVLLGSVPLEDMDLIISPAHRTLIVNPDSPNFPHSLVK